MIKLGFIVPTLNRPQELNRLLQSIYSQSVLPKTIIIVDGTEVSIQPTILRDERVEIIYCHEVPPSLAKQRNRGIAAIPPDLTHVGFLDDDLVIEPGSIASIVKLIENEGSDLGGASFNIIGRRTRSWFFMWLLGQWPLKSGRVGLTGAVEGNCDLKKTHGWQWLCGGATIWRTEVLRAFAFDEWFRGYALWEDVDFSYRVSKAWKLAVAVDARVHHLHKKPTMPRQFKILGDVEVVDRIYFVKKHFPLCLPLAFWAVFGTILRNSLAMIRRREINQYYRVLFNVKALGRILTFRLGKAKTY